MGIVFDKCKKVFFQTIVAGGSSAKNLKTNGTAISYKLQIIKILPGRVSRHVE